jgi:hypothetical protein
VAGWRTLEPAPRWSLWRFGLSGLCIPRGQDKVVTVIEAYCDESGIQDGAPLCIVAGWTATARNWQLFEDRWLKASGGVDFHGKKFFARTDRGERLKPYKGWSDVRAQSYLSGLVATIAISDIRPVGAVIDVAAFKALNEEARQWLTGASWNRQRQTFTTTGAPDQPYYLGFIECLESAAMNVRKSGLVVNFVFDQQHMLAPWALEFFQKAKTQTNTPLSKRLGEAIFKSKAGVGGLQAADMLAHAFYKRGATTMEVPRKLGPDVAREFAIVVKGLNPKIARRLVRYGRPELERRGTELQRHIRREA